MAYARLASVVLAAAFVSLSVRAAPVSVSASLDFRAEDSLWGPNASAASFGASDSAGSASTAKIAYDIGASSGTVEAQFAGVLRLVYDETMSLHNAANAQFAVKFGGFQGFLDTEVGAHLKVDADILDVDIPILNLDYSLNDRDNFTSRFGSLIGVTRDSFDTDQGLEPNIVIASAGVGVRFEITSFASLSVSDMRGELTAVHRDTGTTRTAFMRLDENDGETLGLDLGLAGVWDLQLTDIGLVNRFRSSFEADLTAFANFAIGADCGDRSRDSDNGFLCQGDGEVSLGIGSIFGGGVEIFSTNFALDFGARRSLPAFSILVAEVPEPSTAALLALAIAGLSFGSGKRRTGISRSKSPTRGTTRN